MSTSPSAPPDGHTSFILLCGDQYQVRVVNGVRQINDKCTDTGKERWMTIEEFVDQLCELGQWDKVGELARLGRATFG